MPVRGSTVSPRQVIIREALGVTRLLNGYRLACCPALYDSCMVLSLAQRISQHFERAAVLLTRANRDAHTVRVARFGRGAHDYASPQQRLRKCLCTAGN